jgi:hypothetical protein
MVQQSPLVIVNGRLSQLAPGDQIEGNIPGVINASSGIVGGGDLGTGSKRLDFALAPEASGLIFNDFQLGNDGVALANAQQASASGELLLEEILLANASGAEYLEFAETAYASGTAALDDAIRATSVDNVLILTAASDLVPGTPVGINAAGLAEKITAVNITENVSGLAPSVVTSGILVQDIAYGTVPGKAVMVYTFNGPIASRTIDVIGDSVVLSDPYEIDVTNAIDASARIAYSEAQDNFLCIYNESNDRGGQLVITISGESVIAGTRSVFGVLGDAMTSGILVYHPNTTYFMAHVQQRTTAPEFTYGSTINTRSILNTNPTVSINTAQIPQYNTHIEFGSSVYDKRSGSGILLYSNNNDSGYLNYGVEFTLNTNVDSRPAFPSGVYGKRISETVPQWISSTYVDSIDRCLFTYTASDLAGDPGYSILATVTDGSGYTIDYGDEVPFTEPGTPNVTYTSCAYDKYQEKALVVYQGDPNSYLRLSVGVPSGSTTSGEYNIAWNNKYILKSVVSEQPKIYYHESARRCVVSHYDGNNNQTEIFALTPELLVDYAGKNFYDQTNLIGLASTTAASGDDVGIGLKFSTVGNLSGLETGRYYYLDAISGTLTTENREGIFAPSWSGAKNYGPIGKALSPTSLFLLNKL